MSSSGVLIPRGGTEKLPLDESPIELNGFRLTARSAVPIGRPSLADWTKTCAFAAAVEEAAPYWLADLLDYAETRTDWNERLDQAIAATNLARKTILNHSSVGRKVQGRARQLSPSFTHSRVVAKLEPKEQEKWLEEARSRELTSSEMAREIRRAARRRVIEGQAVLEGLHRVIYADPPWVYGNRPPSGSGAADHYDGMTVEQLCKLPVAAHAHVDAVLFMWVTAPMLYENPGPREVIEAWGFKPKTGIVWDKVDHNFGNYVSVRHEHLLIATRGSCLPDRATPMEDSVQTERPNGEHSSKPASFRRLIERMYDGPYLELFARERVEGWTAFGNDAALWHQQEVAV